MDEKEAKEIVRTGEWSGEGKGLCGELMAESFLQGLALARKENATALDEAKKEIEWRIGREGNFTYFCMSMMEDYFNKSWDLNFSGSDIANRIRISIQEHERNNSHGQFPYENYIKKAEDIKKELAAEREGADESVDILGWYAHDSGMMIAYLRGMRNRNASFPETALNDKELKKWIEDLITKRADAKELLAKHKERRK